MEQTLNVKSKKYPSKEKPWLKYFSEESKKVDVPKGSLYDFISDICREEKANTALHYFGTEYSYEQFLSKIDETADAYYNLGVRAGDIVSFVTVAVPETVFSMYALNKIGAVSNFIDPRGSVNTIKDAIASTKSKIIVVLDIAFPKLEKILPDIDFEYVIVESFRNQLPALKKLLYPLKQKTPAISYGGNVMRWNDFEVYAKKGKCVKADVKDEDLAVITYTGGTTGTPKGVMLTNIGANSVGLAFTIMGFDIKKGDTYLNIMPLSASYGVICGIHVPLTARTKVIMIPNFSIEKLPILIKQYKPNHLTAVPVFYERLTESPLLRNMDLSFLKSMGSGGDTMNTETQRKCNEFFKAHHSPYPVAQGYGLSEAHASASFCVCNNNKIGSVGIPVIFNTISVFKPGTDEELPFGEEGEVCISGPTIFKGYYGKPEETEKVLKLHSDGKLWVHSGDLGTIDEDGFIFIKGRFKRAITRYDGHKVYPLQIENAICTHPSVADCVTVAWRDKSHSQGFLPLSIVKLKDDVSLDDAAKEKLRIELLKLAEELNEERGWPIDVVIADDIPLTALGKDDYRAVEEQYKDYKPHKK